MRALELVNELLRHHVSSDGEQTVRSESVAYEGLEFSPGHVATELNERMPRLNAHVGRVVPDRGHERLAHLGSTRGFEKCVVARDVVFEEEGEVPVGGARVGVAVHVVVLCQ